MRDISYIYLILASVLFFAFAGDVMDIIDNLSTVVGGLGK